MTKQLITALIILASSLRLSAQEKMETVGTSSLRYYLQYGNLLGLGAGGLYELSSVSAVEASFGFNPFVYVLLGPPFDGNIVNMDIQLRLHTSGNNFRMYAAAGGYVGTFDVLEIAWIATPKVSIGFESFSSPRMGVELGAAINVPVEISGQKEQQGGGTLHMVRVRDKFTGTFFPYFKLKVFR